MQVFGLTFARGRRLLVLGGVIAGALLVILLVRLDSSQATSGGDPYSVPEAVDTNPAADVIETTITADETTVNIGGPGAGVTAKAQTYNGTIPGPTIRAKVGDELITHFENRLDKPTAIHWHGIELPNSMDGTPFTQQEVAPGGSFLYKFEFDRPGIYWYHPHHHSSTNQVYKGLYGLILVEDPNDAALRANGTLPPLSQTRPIVLSDMTVCKNQGANDFATYDPTAPFNTTAPHVSGAALVQQLGPDVGNLCEGPVVGMGDTNPYPVDEEGNNRAPFTAGDIPNSQTAAATPHRVNEGQTVLTNGKNVGGRAGSPAAPGALAGGASTLAVQAGQGLRLQLLNAASTRFMRLHLTTQAGGNVPLRRVGGEGGLLNNVVTEGGGPGVPPGAQANFNTLYNAGEILLDPGTRADVVAEIPPGTSGTTMTLWTEDYNRTGQGFSNIPTVPVMHFAVNGNAAVYTLPNNTPLRAATGDLVETLGAATGNFLNPAGFAPPKQGLAGQNMQLSNGVANPHAVPPGTANALGINNVYGEHEASGDYQDIGHIGSSRYAEKGDILQLTVQNTTNANHPFHPHGFSIQPISLAGPAANDDYIWPYKEFRDNVDIPKNYTLTYRVRIDPRPLPDGTTSGGEAGRWVFHCHIFFHATDGMLGEIVVTAPNGNERPNVNVNGTLATVTEGQTASITGTFKDPDGDPVTLSASEGNVTNNGGGNYTWELPNAGGSDRFVYITGTDSANLRSQMPFFLDVSAAPPGPEPEPEQNLPPELQNLRIKPDEFRASGKDTPEQRKKKKGTEIRFFLSEAATVSFKTKHDPPKSFKGKRRPPQKFTRELGPGEQKVRYTGTVDDEKFKPGKYLLLAEAVDPTGLKSARPKVKFQVVGN